MQPRLCELAAAPPPGVLTRASERANRVAAISAILLDVDAPILIPRHLLHPGRMHYASSSGCPVCGNHVYLALCELI